MTKWECKKCHKKSMNSCGACIHCGAIREDWSGLDKKYEKYEITFEDLRTGKTIKKINEPDRPEDIESVANEIAVNLDLRVLNIKKIEEDIKD